MVRLVEASSLHHAPLRNPAHHSPLHLSTGSPRKSHYEGPHRNLHRPKTPSKCPLHGHEFPATLCCWREGKPYTPNPPPLVIQHTHPTSLLALTTPSRRTSTLSSPTSATTPPAPKPPITTFVTLSPMLGHLLSVNQVRRSCAESLFRDQ